MNITLEEIERSNDRTIEVGKLNAGEPFILTSVFVKSDEFRPYNDGTKIMAMKLVTGEMTEFHIDCMVRRVTIKAKWYIE